MLRRTVHRICHAGGGDDEGQVRLAEHRPHVADQVGEVVFVFVGERRADPVVEALVPGKADNLIAPSGPFGELGAEIDEHLARLFDDRVVERTD